MANKLKILSVVGARPQFIKAAPLSNALRRYFKEILVHTGQHYDREMSQLFFEQLKIPRPDYNLGIGSGRHGEQTAKMLSALEGAMLKEKPRLVIVYGDTNSTLAGALAAAKLHIPVAHVEAGMRSFNRKMPEEVNRILADHVSSLLFCSSEQSAKWLRNEGIKKNVNVVGDIMLDAFLNNLKVAQKNQSVLKQYRLIKNNYLLITIHRAENTDQAKNLKTLIQTISSLPKDIIFPIHPRTKKIMRNLKLLNRLLENKRIRLIKPVGYLEMLVLEKYAEKILTDSGGVQKEAYFLKKPCLTLREETEWVETLNGRWNQLTGVDRRKIINALKKSPSSKSYKNYYGYGHTAQLITKTIYRFLST